MRILFIVEHYYPYIGGAEELWKTLAEQMVKESHEVTILTTLFDKELSPLELINGVNIHRLNVINRFGFTIFSIPQAIKLAKDADIIHTSSYNAAFPAWLASKITSTSCIITFHEVWGKLWFQLAGIPLFLRVGYYLFEKLLLKLNFEKFIAVSDFTLQSLRKTGIKNENSIRIYNGLDYNAMTSRDSNAEHNEFVFCYYGRLGLSKGYQLIIPAFAQLLHIHSDIKLKLIIPQYPKKAFLKLKAQVTELNLDKHIIWHHDLSKNELFYEVSQSNAVIIPSFSEGFCFVAAEATALNVPIISSQRGALKEVVGGKYITIESLNELSLLESMKKGLSHQWSYKQAKHFSIKMTVNKYIQLYYTILKS